MVTKAIETVSDYLTNFGLEAIELKIKNRINEKKLRESLMAYIESQQKYNEVCSLAEEIDFQGLIDYVKNNLIDVTRTRFFDPNRSKRRQAREQIVDAAVAFSNADTDEAKYRVSKYISICLDIIRGFYEEHHLSLKEFLLSDMIVDTVADEVSEAQTTVVTAVDSAKKEILAQIDNTGSLFCINKALTFAKAGETDTIRDEIKKMLDHISLEHPYYPHFGYDYRNGMILSKPLTEEAKKLYPPKYVLTGPVKIGNQYYNNPNGNPLDYSYRHQIPITLEISKATKLLGEKPDPRQDEMAGLEGQKLIASPPEFPPAFPCAIKVGETIFFEYILLRTQEILDDGTYIIGNKDQGGSFYFEIRINPQIPSSPDFSMKIRNATNRELLNFVRFMTTLSKEKDLHIYVLALGEDIIAGYINGIDYQTGFSSVDEEIDFLERVCVIEDYFHIQLNPHGEISYKEYKTVIQISDLIRNEEVLGTWNEATFTGVLTQHFREELINMDKEEYRFSYVGISHVELFGAEFEFRFMRTFKDAQMVDIEKVRRKAEVLDDGDEIKITFRAGNDKRTIDTLKIPDNIERAS